MLGILVSVTCKIAVHQSLPRVPFLLIFDKSVHLLLKLELDDNKGEVFVPGSDQS